MLRVWIKTTGGKGKNTRPKHAKVPTARIPQLKSVQWLEVLAGLNSNVLGNHELNDVDVTPNAVEPSKLLRLPAILVTKAREYQLR
jgi:hypothetical protein